MASGQVLAALAATWLPGHTSTPDAAEQMLASYVTAADSVLRAATRPPRMDDGMGPAAGTLTAAFEMLAVLTSVSVATKEVR
eukprot:scaffold201361_cov49-Prasinocladus_malaysianus.AAC.4